MNREDIKNVFSIDDSALEVNNIQSNLLSGIDACVLDLSAEISEDSFLIYKKFVDMKQEAPEGMKKNLFNTLIGYINEKMANNQNADALLLLRFLAVKSELMPDSFYKIGEILSRYSYLDLSNSFIRLYESKETNKPLLFLTLANFYNLELKDYKTAIKYYEKYIKIDETKSVIYTILASLYAKLYGDLSLKDQIYYFTKAYNLKPNDRLSMHGLAFCYEKLGDMDNAKYFYELLLENNPTETDFYNYGAFLISSGDFIKGHKYFAHRFNTEDKNLVYPITVRSESRWNFVQDISDKTLLVHYEQGFGDTFMYCRFVPMLKKIAKNIIFVVQDELFDLLNNSPEISEGIEIIKESSGIENIQYDFHMALLDIPHVLGISAETMPYAQGYLTVSEDRVKEYAQKYLNNNYKLKVGIAYHGNKSANYHGRDIDFNRFKTLLTLENIEFYSLQAEAEEEDGVISLGSSFNDFTDTACALKNMDIVISTDNVILNLAGALGVKVLGLYNKHTNYRWYKLTGSDVGWYKSVKPLQVEENNCWSDVFSSVNNYLSEVCQVAGK